MDEKQKMKRMVNELLDMRLDGMEVYIDIDDSNLTVEFYSPETTIGIARVLEWDSFYNSIEEMLQEFKDALRIHRERMAKEQQDMEKKYIIRNSGPYGKFILTKEGFVGIAFNENELVLFTEEQAKAVCEALACEGNDAPKSNPVETYWYEEYPLT